jgi:hypothetical protein
MLDPVPEPRCPRPVRQPQPTNAELFEKIDHILEQDPTMLEPVITELHALLNRHDPEVDSGARAKYGLVKEGFRHKEVMKRIRQLKNCPKLTIADVRFEADVLSKRKRIPLTATTRKYKQPLLQWFDVHWDELQGELTQAVIP